MNDVCGDRAIDLIHIDDDLLVLCKPAGMLTHEGWARDGPSLVREVRRLFDAPEASPLHRLDRGTSGVILFARHAEAARRLGRCFREGWVRKRYVALVRGTAPDEALVDHPLPRKPGGPRVPSRTFVRRIAVAETEPRWVSLVEARPVTGRLHQVRRHLKHLSHPVIGDANYGRGALNRALRERYGLARLALHAAEVVLERPDEPPEAFRAPLPKDLVEPLERMGFDPSLLHAL